MAAMPGFHALRSLPEERVSDKITRRVLTGDKEMSEDFLTHETPAYMRQG